MDFKIRLACAGDYTTEHIFMSAEISLFCYRLQSLSETGVKRFMHQFCQLREYFLNSSEMLSPSVELREIRELLSVLDDCSVDWKSVIAGYVSCTKKKCGHEFRSHTPIAVPFHFVPRLVAQHKVVLNKGKALVAPSQLPQILAVVFRKWLKYSILLARMWQPCVTTGDDRFTLLFRECKVSTFLLYFCQYLLFVKCLHFNNG